MPTLKKQPRRSAKKFERTPSGTKQKRYQIPVNVFDAALERTRWVFDEFDGKVVVFTSGGKDSTCAMEVAARVAAEKNQLPLHVVWLDQEVELASTVEYQRSIAYERDDIEFHWYQVPFTLDNATNHENHHLNVWGPDDERWMRDKDPISIKENPWGEYSFYKLLHRISHEHFHGWASLDGIRVEESPQRRVGSVAHPCYKWATWSSGPKSAWREGVQARYRFRPIYDWLFSDVWHAIHSNGWAYNKHYDMMFTWGMPSRGMRVSAFTHDQALPTLHYLQEIEPDTWERAVLRLEGINAYGHTLGEEMPSSLPYMFASWYEYMEHLIEKVPGTREQQDAFNNHYSQLRSQCTRVDPEIVARIVARAVIKNDSYGKFRRLFEDKYADTENDRRESRRQRSNG